VLGDGDREVLGDLAPTHDGADRLADRGGTAQRPTRSADATLDVGELTFAGLEQIAALARPLLGQRRVAAHDQPLAGIIRARDLRQIALVEPRQLQGPARGRQPLNGRGAQRGDPVEAGRPQLGLDARLGDQPAVTDQDHPGQAEALPDLGDLRRQRARIADAAVEHLDWADGQGTHPPGSRRARRAAQPRSAACRAGRRGWSRSGRARSSGPPGRSR
jgi:hypothetical protein